MQKSMFAITQWYPTRSLVFGYLCQPEYVHVKIYILKYITINDA